MLDFVLLPTGALFFTENECAWHYDETRHVRFQPLPGSVGWQCVECAEISTTARPATPDTQEI